MSTSKLNNENQKITLESYRTGANHYIESTRKDVSGSLKDYLDFVLSKIPADSTILEIGSANGRDADYIESKGYSILRTDAVGEFVEIMRDSGKDVLVFDILHDKLNKKFDAVIATAVFLHFTLEQFRIALKNAYSHLSDNGTVVIALKKGVGEEYTDYKMNTSRYFKYWEENQLEQEMGAAKFTDIETSTYDDNKWLVAIARK